MSTTQASPATTLQRSYTLAANAHPVAKTLEPFVCGGAAATFASIIIHPIDLAKASCWKGVLNVLLYSLLIVLLTGSNSTVRSDQPWKARPFLPKTPIGHGQE